MPNYSLKRSLQVGAVKFYRGGEVSVKFPDTEVNATTVHGVEVAIATELPSDAGTMRANESISELHVLLTPNITAQRGEYESISKTIVSDIVTLDWTLARVTDFTVRFPSTSTSNFNLAASEGGLVCRYWTETGGKSGQDRLWTGQDPLCWCATV